MCGNVAVADCVENGLTEAHVVDIVTVLAVRVIDSEWADDHVTDRLGFKDFERVANWLRVTLSRIVTV